MSGGSSAGLRGSMPQTKFRRADVGTMGLERAESRSLMQTASPVKVATVAAFVDAIADGAKDIILTNHMDMTTENLKCGLPCTHDLLQLLSFINLCFLNILTWLLAGLVYSCCVHTDAASVTVFCLKRCFRTLPSLNAST